jgi:membrane associated rhomboid family serine protease
MFPLSDENPHFLAPLTTCALIVLNVLAGIFVQRFGSESGLGAFICDWGLVPGELLRTLAPGTRWQIGPHVYCVVSASPNWFTPLTHMFLHGGWLHLIVNMWFLWIFGGNVEDSMGHGRFIAFYLLCGLAAAASQIYVNPRSEIPMVGASGAIGGVMGAYILLYPWVQVKVLLFLGVFSRIFTIDAVWMLGFWFVAQLVGGVGAIGAHGAGVAFWAHAGGFVAGALLVFLFRDPELVARHPNYGWSR